MENAMSKITEIYDRVLDRRNEKWWNQFEKQSIPILRRFVLIRAEDVSGVSGTGIVAEGALSCTRKVVLFWLTKYQSVAIYETIDDLMAIHGHDGRTTIRWIDVE
jgi:hypothetical protein